MTSLSLKNLPFDHINVFISISNRSAVDMIIFRYLFYMVVDYCNFIFGMFLYILYIFSLLL